MVLICFTKVLKCFEVEAQYRHQSKVVHMYFSEGILVHSADWRKHNVFSLCSQSHTLCPLPLDKVHCLVDAAGMAATA